MVEKQASSEIAQSRERFEKWCPITITNIDKAPKTAALKSAYWTAWQAAERDTRERCAQIARKSIDTTLAAASVTILSYEEVLDIAARTILGELDGN